jgi:Carboxypeptidase regulatory-like domain/Domain of unknown function DUF11
MYTTLHSMRHTPWLARLVFILALVALVLGGAPARAATPAAAGTLQISMSGPIKAGKWLPGESLTFSITLHHAGGTTPIDAELRDALPDGLALDGRPTLQESALGAVRPHLVGVAQSANVVEWSGQIDPDSDLTLLVPARVERCFGDDRTIANTATAKAAGGSSIEASFTIDVDCASVTIAQVDVQQVLSRTPLDQPPAVQAAPAEPEALAPGQPATIRTTVRNNSTEPISLSLNFEPIRFEYRPAAPNTPADQLGHFEIGMVRLGPGQEQSFERPVLRMESEFTDELTLDAADVFLISAVTYCLAEAPVACPSPAERPQIAARDVLAVPIHRSDLGDAPDSSNHFGAAMTAYPGVPAHFPTVFDPATGLPPGPLHRNPRPFHLGQRVSLELEADIGPDQDPFHNIVPPANNPDNDRYDDGIRPNTLSFQNCRPSTFQASVFIHPRFQAAALQQGLTQVYLNVWVDGRRDGDWDDMAHCPPVADQPGGPALEHIVIDQKIDIAALQPGVNILPVVTGRVLWPDDLKDRPAWLRVTLSDRPSNKTMQVGDIRYGDGRGYADSFRTGETEDYLINRGDANGADIEIRKWARVERFDPASPADGRIAWVIEYRNRGDRPAREVVIRDQLDGGLNIIAILIGVMSRPELPYREDGTALVFNAGDVAPGEGGRIVIETKIPPIQTWPRVIRNLATARAANDANTANNQASAEVRLGLPAPRITRPGNGTTSHTHVTIAGRSVPGSSVSVFDESASIDGTSLTDAQGRWQAAFDLRAGRHSITAQATLGNQQSPRSVPLFLIVDPTLPYDPLSMRLTGPQGRSYRPMNERGRTDDGGWRVYLKINTSYEFAVESSCTELGAQFQLKIGDDAPVDLADPDSDGAYRGVFTTGSVKAARPFVLIVTCGALRYTSGGTALWDPEGVVTDAATGQPLAGATVTLLEQTSEGPRPWLAEEYGQQNPQTTGDDGHYSFYTPPGAYVVEVRHAGYQTYHTEELVVADEPVERDIALTPLTPDGAAYVLAIDEAGFDSPVLRVRPGATVEVVNVDVWEHAIVSPRDVASGLATGQRLSGQLAPGERYRMTLDGASKDAAYLTDAASFTVRDSENGFNLATIIVDPAAPLPNGQYTVFLPLIQR